MYLVDRVDLWKDECDQEAGEMGEEGRGDEQARKRYSRPSRRDEEHVTVDGMRRPCFARGSVI